MISVISREGKAACQIIEDATLGRISRFVRKVVADKVDLIATDEAGAYRDFSQIGAHWTVDHKTGEYVRGVVHTNNIESFWSFLKRGVMGTFYDDVSKDYLPLYLAKFPYRYNHWKDPPFLDNLVAGC